MLTLKEPVKLNSIRSFTVQSDQLAEKLEENYQVMGISVSPQDLLHITTLTPEVFVGMEAQNTFITENRIEQNYEQKYEIINQLLNRILLYQTPQFTYQDEVYVTTVLQKMGITNVSEFMEQVRQNQIQNNQTVRLLKQYEENQKVIREKIQDFTKEERVKELLLSPKTADITDENYFSNEIYHRLQTAEYSNALYNYRMQLHREENYQKEDLSVIWQSWQSDQIKLSQLKQLLFQEWREPSVWRENRYEQKLIPAEQITEKNVLTQLAAGMLVALTQELAYYQTKKEEYGTYSWHNFRNVLYESTADVIERFEEFHTNVTAGGEEIYQASVSMNHLRNQELMLLENISMEIQDKEIAPGYQKFQRESYLTLLQNQNLQQQFSENKRIWTILSSADIWTENNQIDKARTEELKERGKWLLKLQKETNNEIFKEVRQYKKQLNNWNIAEQYINLEWEKNLKWISINREKYYTEAESFSNYITDVVEKTDKLKDILTQLEKTESVEEQKKEELIFEQLKEEQLQDVFLIKKPQGSLTREEYHDYLVQLEKETDCVREKMTACQLLLEKNLETTAGAGNKMWRNIADTTIQELQYISEKQEKPFFKITYPQYFITEESYEAYLMQLRKELVFLQKNVPQQLQLQKEQGISNTDAVIEKITGGLSYLQMKEPEEAQNEKTTNIYLNEIEKQAQQLSAYFENHSIWQREIQKAYIAGRRQEREQAGQTDFNPVNKQMPVASTYVDQNLNLTQDISENEGIPADISFAPAAFQTEEEYISYLTKMNERNEKIHEKITAEQKEVREQKNQINLDRKNARELALRALNNPQEVLKEVYENGEGIQTPLNSEIEQLLQYTDEQTRQFYLSIINQGQKGTSGRKPEIGLSDKPQLRYAEEESSAEINPFGNEAGMISLANARQAVQNVSSNHRVVQQLSEYYAKTLQVHKQQNVIRKEYETLFEKSEQNFLQVDTDEQAIEHMFLKEQREQKEKNYLHRLTENLQSESQIAMRNYKYVQNVQDEKMEKLNMVHHKSLQMDEELMEEVKNSLQSELHQTKNEIQTVRTEQIVEKKVTETKQDILNTTQKSISQMIQQNLRTQVQSISDEVYRNIEHRLNNERKRRGY